MKFKFRAKIYKVGINPCVKVPLRITNQLVAIKGYIPVKGKIQDHSFTQTLVPVKGQGYRLYVNTPMLSGANVRLGQTVYFEIEQDHSNRNKRIRMPDPFKRKLVECNLMTAFKALTPSRQKEILKYLHYLKTEESLTRNIEKVIRALAGTEASSLFRIK